MDAVRIVLAIQMEQKRGNSVEEAKIDCYSSWKDLIKGMFLEDE